MLTIFTPLAFDQLAGGSVGDLSETAFMTRANRKSVSCD